MKMGKILILLLSFTFLKNGVFAQEAKFFPYQYLYRLSAEAKIRRIKRVILYLLGGVAGTVYGVKEKKESITVPSVLLSGAGVWNLCFKSGAERDFLRVSAIEDVKEREAAATLSLIILSCNARKGRILEAIECAAAAVVLALEGKINFSIPLLLTSAYRFLVKSEEEEVYRMYLKKKEEGKRRRRY